MIIVKNWLEKDLHEFLKIRYLYFTPHCLAQKSGSKSKNTFYISNLDHKDPLTMYLHVKIQKILDKKLNFLRTYLNVQHINMNGNWHYDDGKITCLYMVTGNGNFEIKNETSIPFEENKLICFDAKKIHRGLAPKEGIRITWATKTIDA